MISWTMLMILHSMPAMATPVFLKLDAAVSETTSRKRIGSSLEGHAAALCLKGSAFAGQKGGPFKDGGLYDRTGLKAWRERRAQQGAGVPPALVHLIARSSSFSGADDVESTGQHC